jgi:hypothetical protein
MDIIFLVNILKIDALVEGQTLEAYIRSVLEKSRTKES